MNINPEEFTASATEEVNAQPDLSQYTLNTIPSEVFKSLSYWEKWSIRRQAGLFFYTATYAIYFFVAYVSVKMFYLVYAKNFNFSLDWWSLPAAIGVWLGYWFIHEIIYESKKTTVEKK